MRIVLAAVVSRQPFSPGMAWNWMQLAVGLRRLGHTVHVVEQLEERWCVDASGTPARFGASENRATFARTLRAFGLLDDACQLAPDRSETTGMPLARLAAVAREADLLLNMSGHLRIPELRDAPAVRVYVDQDPVYTQLWVHRYGKDIGLREHDVHLTVGLALGTASCPIPTAGVTWEPLLPVVVPDFWEVDPPVPGGAYTTIASWVGYGDVEHLGRWYSGKHTEFVKLASLARRVGPRLQVALTNHDPAEAGVRALEAQGWSVIPARSLTTLGRYRQYLRGSRGEIAVAKNAYVQSRSGWFSDRSAHYLASGRPVIAQSSGLEHLLPVGAGFLTFTDVPSAAEAIAAVEADRHGHARAARRFACDVLDYRVVLPPLLERLAGGRLVGSVAG